MEEGKGEKEEEKTYEKKKVKKFRAKMTDIKNKGDLLCI